MTVRAAWRSQGAATVLGKEPGSGVGDLAILVVGSRDFGFLTEGWEWGSCLTKMRADDRDLQ